MSEGIAKGSMDVVGAPEAAAPAYEYNNFSESVQVEAPAQPAPETAPVSRTEPEHTVVDKTPEVVIWNHREAAQRAMEVGGDLMARRHYTLAA